MGMIEKQHFKKFLEFVQELKDDDKNTWKDLDVEKQTMQASRGGRIVVVNCKTNIAAACTDCFSDCHCSFPVWFLFTSTLSQCSFHVQLALSFFRWIVFMGKTIKFVYSRS